MSSAFLALSTTRLLLLIPPPYPFTRTHPGKNTHTHTHTVSHGLVSPPVAPSDEGVALSPRSKYHYAPYCSGFV